MKRGFCIIGIFLSLLVRFASVPPTSWAEEAATTLRVGIFPFEPINYTDETGQAQGLYPDLLREIAREEHWELEFVPGSWSEGLDRLQNGAIDLMESVAYSQKRSEVMDFTHESVMELWGQVFIRPEGSVLNISDLTGRRVAIMHDDISGANFIATSREFNVQCEILEFPSHGDVFNAVKEGVADAGVAPQHFGLRHAKAYDLVPSTIQFSPFSIYFATKKGMHFDILAKIDRHLIIWKEDKGSFYYQRLNHWLGIHSLSSPVIPRWLLWTLAAIVVTAITFLIMSMILKFQVKKRTREQRKSEATFRAVAELSPMAIYSSSGDNQKATYINDAFYKTFGFSMDDVPTVGHWWRKAFPDEKYRRQVMDQWVYNIEQANKSNTAVKALECVCTCKDGSQKIIVWVGKTIGDEFWAFGYDFTERKQAEEKFKQLNIDLEQRVIDRTTQLEAVNKDLEAFSYSVSHDLRAPLRAVDGYIRMLVEDYEASLDAEGKRICSVISESARDMGKLIDDLLAFSRVGRTVMQPSSVDMATMSQSIYFEVTTPETRERIDFKVGPLPSVVGDQYLIKQVWMNLLRNAVKFSSKKERAVIEVSAEQQGGETVYAVRDNGAGFNMQYVNKLFSVFQRLHSSREFEGTGVGLAIVQRIVCRHGGRVWAEGETDKGATFYFTLKQGDQLWTMQP